MIATANAWECLSDEYLTAAEAMFARDAGEVAIVRGGRFFTIDADRLPDLKAKKAKGDEHAVIGRDVRYEADEASLVTLSFSGGRQSTWILEKILRGEWEKPENFLVVCADPGNEAEYTYEVVERYRKRCEAAGIEFIVADGPKIEDDLLAIVKGEKGRIDNPPLWTSDEDDLPELPEELKDHPQGQVFARHCDIEDRPDVYRQHARKAMKNRGQLMQCCTSHYKIAPIRRAIRDKVRKLGIALKPGCVETWIGFASHEHRRAEKAKNDVQWQRLRFPMIERDVSADEVAADWKRWELPQPAVSMCNNCPFHGLRSLKQMHEERPTDWMRAVWSDQRMRRFSNAGCKRPVYQSETLLPLESLTMLDFDLGETINEMAGCDSGLCLV